MSSTTIRLILDVAYNLNGESVQEMSARLQHAAQNAVGDGLLTGETSAEVETFNIQVAETPPLISEEEVAAFMRQGIEDGTLDVEDIPVRLARYGLQEPGAFMCEMFERMEMAADDAPQCPQPG